MPLTGPIWGGCAAIRSTFPIRCQGGCTQCPPPYAEAPAPGPRSSGPFHRARLRAAARKAVVSVCCFVLLVIGALGARKFT